ncbi:MAG: hypothetical protein IT444_10700 [Phycisphaeraceae bacterium]|nr:hypothetical protein [Phycisphaeraceae bacterium]
MFKRVFMIAAAFALAGVVLLLTMLAEPSKQKTEHKPLTQQSGGLHPVDPQKMAQDLTEQPLLGVGITRITRVNDHGQVIQIFVRELEPKPQGVLDAKNPICRMHLTPSRVLEIRAVEGTFVAPDRQPRNGEFRGRVVLTLFDGPQERPVRLDRETGDIAMRVFLEDAKFDIELGQIESEGNVHLTTPRIDFIGKGLQMTFNPRKKRLEHLEVPYGKSIRIKTQGGNDRISERNGGATTKKAGVDDKVDVNKADEAPQFYRATLERRVRIQSDTMDVDADQLLAIFALGRNAGREGELLGGSKKKAALSEPPLPSHRAAALPLHSPLSESSSGMRPLLPGDPRTASALLVAQNVLAQTQPVDPWKLPEEKVLADVSPTDLIVQWSGALTVDPEDHPPAEIDGPDDTMFSLVGKPLRVTTYPRNVKPDKNGNRPVQERISAAGFDYFTKSGRVRLTGNDKIPMTLDSLAMGGRLRGTKLDIDQGTGFGRIDGGGVLEGSDPDVIAALNPDAARPDNRLPPGLKISWKDRLDMTFFLRTAEEKAAAGKREDSEQLIRLTALKQAAFHGDVTADHPEFGMRADTISLALDDPIKGKQTLDTIHAAGSVHVESKSQKDEEKLAITSDELDIELATDAKGKMQPSRLLARNKVKAALPGRTLETQLLDVGLALVDPTTMPADAQSKPAAMTLDPGTRGARLVMKTMVARDGVHIVTEDPLDIAADRLVADTTADQIELFGVKGKPASVRRNEILLTGNHLVMHQGSQTVRVQGPGVFDFPIKSAIAPGKEKELVTRPAAAQKAGETKGPPDNLAHVTWNEAMLYDNTTGKAQFQGKVEIVSRSNLDTTKLRCGDLQLEFVTVPQAADKQAPSKRGMSLDQMAGGTKAIKSLVASDNARFEAESWADYPGGNILRRLTLEGPTLTFLELTEELTVDGKGWMQMQDYRPDTRKADATTQPEGGLVTRFSGRGDTLMKWTGKMILNANHNDMTVMEGVQMIHREPDSKEFMQMDCQRFVADLASTGGLGVWVSQKTQPTLKAISADKDVVVHANGRVIRTDHLLYTEDTQIVSLKGEGGRMVEVIEPGEPTPYTAEEFQWDLKNSRLTVIRPGTGRVPLK